MRKSISFDLFVLILGIIAIVLIRNSTRFIGVGLISLGITYLLIDRITLIKESKINKKNKMR